MNGGHSEIDSKSKINFITLIQPDTFQQGTPKLLNYNVFTERYYKLKIIEAFDHQLQVIELLKNSFEDFDTNLKIRANLIYLKTSIGSGKTTLAIAIASLIDWIRNKTKIQEYSLIFACSIDIVREYVGRMAYNSGISFAIATSKFSEVKIINSFSCREVKNVNLIITFKNHSNHKMHSIQLENNENYNILELHLECKILLTLIISRTCVWKQNAVAGYCYWTY